MKTTKKNILPCEQLFDLRTLLTKFHSQFEVVVRSRAIILEISVSEQTPRNFFGDPLRLNDILKNLCTYALNYLDDGCIFINVQA